MEEPMKLSPQAQQALIQMQTFQQQMHGIVLQKETLNLQNMEISKALDELEKAKDGDDVFKAVGPILIKSSKKDMEKDLKEKKETIGLRVNNLEKQEGKLQEKMKEVQKKIQDILKPKTAE